jgi:hypothetical protein
MSGKEGLKPGEFRCWGKVVSPPQTSIHPRVVNGKTRYPKVNTAKAPRGK